MPARRFRLRLITRKAAKRLGVLALLIAAFLFWAWFSMIRMPGESFAGPLPPLSEDQADMRHRLEAHVHKLAVAIGPRSKFQPQKLSQALAYARAELEGSGFTVRDHSFPDPDTGLPNIDVTITGTTYPQQIVVIGAHIDTVQNTAGADDNASGVAGVLELASHFAQHPQARTLRFAIFINEEPPSFWTEQMGSLAYAKKCKADGDDVVAMLSIESIGYFDDAPGSQQYPSPLNLFYPDTGNFIGFVGNYGSRGLVRRCVRTFRAEAEFPSQGAALPAALPGIGWSDHWSFWQIGCEAVMVTGTATFRNPHYHEHTDTIDKLDFDRMARVVEGLVPVIEELATVK